MARKSPHIFGTITLKGEPKSTQNAYRISSVRGFASTYMSSVARGIKLAYQWQAKMQWNQPLLTEPIDIDVKLYFGTKKRVDWDNFHKLSMDALTGFVWEDDSQVKKATVEILYDKENPRTEITVIERLPDGVKRARLPAITTH